MFTVEYLFFLFVIVVVYYLSPQRFQRYIILLASFGFLGYFSITFLVYALVFSSVNYLFGLFIEKQVSKRTKKIFYFTILIFDIGILFLFKYINLLIESLNFITHLFSDQKTFPLYNIILPIGISYYTFQCIGYIYRVYKGMEPAEKSFIDFSIYTLFFPKILAGPIEFSNRFLPQLRMKMVLKQDNITEGLQLILLGFFKKLVIADNLGVIVNTTNSNLDEYSGFAIILVFLLQPLHMYFDFSGYTDIALGSAKLFGYKLTDNFNRPFFAQNVTTFWKRFHISLTAWCHDFIFNIVLYKRRKWKDWGAIYAVFVTFIVVGIWHGPTLNFLIVGLLQAFAISFEFLTRKQRYKFFKKFTPGFSKFIGRIITYLYYSVTLIFFNLTNLADVSKFIRNAFTFDGTSIDWNLLYESEAKLVLIAIIILIYFIIEALQEKKYPVLHKFNRLRYFYKYAFYYLIIYIIIWYGGVQQEFIYFQF